MADVRIFKPSKTATQSGQNNIKSWVMEFEPRTPKQTDPLMGWVGSADTREQVQLKFGSKEEAVAFAKKSGFTSHIQEPTKVRVKIKNYADNFSFQKLF